MKKSNFNNLLITLVCVALLFTGCNGTGPPPEANYHVGTKGLDIEIVNKNALDEIYEDTNFAFSLAIDNTGAYDVLGENKAIITLGFDPYYIQTLSVPNDGITTVGKSSVLVNGLELAGKSKYTPTGSKAFLYFPYFKTKPIEGQRAKPETQLFASLCYPYATTFSSLVCVDFDAYQDNARTQVCTQKDISSSSQGAPIAITRVEVENYPAGTFVKPVYTIHISNVGRGTILSPADNLAEISRVCAAESITKQDFNKVKVEAWLSNNMKLDCTPGVIRMNDNIGVTRCAVSDEDVEKRLSGRQNYQAPITINLSYVYMTTLKQDITIKRINPYGSYTSEEEGDSECETFQVKVQGKCMNRCDYCITNPTDPVCTPSDLKYDINWNGGFACKCSKTTCDGLYPKGNCVPTPGLCGPATYCCSNPCGTNQVRNDADGGDGLCYDKCSNSCAGAQQNCACTVLNGYSIAKVKGFCSKDGQVYVAKEECTAANKAFASKS